jgi:hypothetical protein
VLRPGTAASCDSCPPGYTTSSTGSTKPSDCELCLPGWGDNTGALNAQNCSMQCGGSTYGPPGRDATQRKCLECPTGSGFSFDVLASNQLYVPDTVSRIGADSSADCLSEFAQIVDDACKYRWRSQLLLAVTCLALAWHVPPDQGASCCARQRLHFSSVCHHLSHRAAYEPYVSFTHESKLVPSTTAWAHFTS